MADGKATGIGRVIAAHGRRGKLETLSGDRLPYLVQGRRLRVVCGDLVDWDFDNHGKLAIITGITPRSNALERQPPGRPGTEVLAANLELMIVVCAPKPEPDWFLIDRYLCTGELMGCRLLLISNKSDLTEPECSYQTILRDYERIGYACLSVSAQTKRGLDALRDALHDRTGIFVGQSGVGKSSLINRLVPNADITVRAISAATQEGTHRLVDTPGVRDFIPAIPEPTSVQAGFPELLAAAGQCRFSDCRHLREPDCGVKKAVQSGAITARRYESYKRLLRTVNG